MRACPGCAAKLLLRLTDGDPESFLGYAPEEEDPGTNTRVLLASLLDVLSQTIVEAINEEDDATYDAAAEDRESVVLVYADALRSQRYAEAVWLHIATRGPDGPDGPDALAEVTA